MSMPYLLCAAAVAAAALAAYIGHLMGARRARRLQCAERAQCIQRRRRAVLAAHRLTIAGQMARDPNLWGRWWNERAAHGLDDELNDVLRGGA